MWKFLSVFCSYLMLMLVIVIVAALGFIVGRVLKKMKNNKQMVDAETVSEVENMQ